SGPLVGSVVVHAALIVAVLATTRNAGPNSHAANQLAREATPVVHLQYLTLLPSDLPGKAPSASEKRATTPRRSALGERQSTKARLATMKKTLREITDRLADVRPTFDVADVVNNIAVDESRWTAVADSEFNKAPPRLSDAIPTPMAEVKDGIYTP